MKLSSLRLIALFLASAGLLSSCNLETATTSSDLAELEAKAAAAAPADSGTTAAPKSSGSKTVETPAKESASTSSGSGSSSGPAGGFLWKPVSDSTGNLAVVLPSSYKGVNTIQVSGAKSESSSRSAIANGDRPHYRFSSPGAAYGKNIRVTGGGRTWVVADGSKRTEL